MMDTIRKALAFAALVLAGIIMASCSSTNPPKSAGTEAPQRYASPVAVGCVGKEGRPAVPTTLKQRYSDAEWASLPPGSKSQAVAAQAGERMNYEDKDRAATAACR